MAEGILDTQRYTAGGNAVLEDQYLVVSVRTALAASYAVGPVALSVGALAATYAMRNTAVAATLGGSYTVAVSVDLALGAAYAVRATPSPVEEALTYLLRSTPAAVAAALTYNLRQGGLLPLDADYRVRAAQAIQLSAQYAVPSAGESVTMQLGASYVVETNTGVRYVDVDSIGGAASDSNAGTSPSAPWLTIKHAASVSPAGTDIQVRAGTYTETNVTFGNSGTYAGNALKYTRIRAYPGETVVWDGGFHGTESGTIKAPIFTETGAHNYLSVEDIEGINAYYQFWYTGNSTAHTRLRARNMHIHDVYGWVGDNAAAIRWDNTTDGLIQDCHVHDIWNQNEAGGHPLSGHSNGIMTFGAVRLHITGCHIHDCANLIMQKKAPSGGQDADIVDHCVLHNAQSGNVAVRYGYQSGGGSEPIYYHAVVHHNVFYSNPGGDIYGELYYGADINQGIQVYNNTFVGPRPYTMRGGFRDTQFWNNIVVCTGGSGDWRFKLEDGYYSTDETILYMDYNLYDSSQTARSWLIAQNTAGAYGTTSFASWQSLLASAHPTLLFDHPDANGLSADPLFTDRNNFNFTLQPTSPAIGAGRFGGDMGALEFTGTPPTTTIQTAAKYTVATTVTALTPAARYAVAVATPLALGAAYSVRATPAAATLSSVYAVQPPHRLLAGLTYAVLTAPPAAIKAAPYRVLTTPAALTEAATYRVSRALLVGKTAWYKVDGEKATLTALLRYAVRTPMPVPLGLATAVRRPVAPALGLTYVVGGGIRLQKAAAYRVRAQTIWQQITKYALRATPAGVGLGAAYELGATPKVLTRGLAYALTLGAPGTGLPPHEFPVETVADRAALLADFGTNGTYTPPGGGGTRAVRGVLDLVYDEVGTGYAPVAGRRVTFLTPEHYWPDEDFTPAVGGTLELAPNPIVTITYTIRAAEPDGTGWVLLILEAP